MNIYQTLPYILGAFTAVGAGLKWMYGSLKKERNHYFKLYTEKEHEVEKLKDQINQLKIKLVEIKASQRGAFFDGKDHKQ